MKLFKTVQIKEIDSYTIQNEPIDSYELMERAASAFVDAMLPFLESGKQICVFAGPGNNGGDALVIARFLMITGLPIDVFLVSPENSISADCEKAKAKLLAQFPDSLVEIVNAEAITIPKTDYIVDGLFGSGLSRPLDGVFANVVSIINNSGAKVFSVDIPSGLMGEDNKGNNLNAIVRATYTFSFQFPKLAFLLSENELFVGKFIVLDIGLYPKPCKILHHPII
jgi:NAD(P)H-hydrate epimerase